MIDSPSACGHIGFIGTRQGLTYLQSVHVMRFLCYNTNGWFHHGDSIGADKEAHGLARQCGLFIEIHPPLCRNRRALCIGDMIHIQKGYISQRYDIVDACDEIIATPKTKKEDLRSIVWKTVRYAKDRNKKVTIIFPDGSCCVKHPKDIV